MVVMQVVVPDGLFPGDVMNVEAGGQEFAITVPDGVYPGDPIEVDLPVADEAAPAATESCTIVVPDGIGPGEGFTVETAWGGSFEITVPDGVFPGDSIEVELPTQAAHEQQQAAEEPPPSRQPRPRARTPHEMVGRRAALCGLVAKGILNGKKGLVHSYNEERDRMVLTLDGMAPDVAVRFENLEECASDDEAPVDDEPPEAPPAGVHYVGDRVLVERSGGQTSLGTVVEYDEVFENYVIDVGNGVLKYGVEESYLTPYETSSDWAGPCKGGGGYFVGRRVRLPHLGRFEADKNGRIRGYDDVTKLYSVEMDSGVWKRTVHESQIKVMYQLVPK